MTCSIMFNHLNYRIYVTCWQLYWSTEGFSQDFGLQDQDQDIRLQDQDTKNAPWDHLETKTSWYFSSLAGDILTLLDITDTKNNYSFASPKWDSKTVKKNDKNDFKIHRQMISLLDRKAFGARYWLESKLESCSNQNIITNNSVSITIRAGK